VISFLARNELPEYYLLLAGHYSLGEYVCLGFDGLYLGGQNSRHHDGSTSLCRGCDFGSSDGAIFVGVIFRWLQTGCASAFFEGGSKEHELHGESEV
jgi:hypothetical protein